MQLAIVIMAAGKGTRLKSRRPKVLHQIGGRALVEHVIAAAALVVEPKDIFVVIGHEAEQVRAALAHTGVRFVVQAEQRGTGHAIQTTRSEVEGYESLIVLSGDAPLITTDTILRLRDFHLEHNAAMTILTARPVDPTGYGRVIRKSGNKPEVTAIVEQKALKPEQQSAPEINSGIYAFRTETLFRHIGELSTENAHGEYYLTDMARVLVKAGERVLALESGDIHQVLGANTIAEMMDLDAAIRMRKARELMAAGVTVYRPETSVIDSTVTVAADTILEPFVQIVGPHQHWHRLPHPLLLRHRRFDPRGQRAGPERLHHPRLAGCERRVDRPLRASSSGVRDRRGRACGELCRDQEDPARRGCKGQPP